MDLTLTEKMKSSKINLKFNFKLQKKRLSMSKIRDKSKFKISLNLLYSYMNSCNFIISENKTLDLIEKVNRRLKGKKFFILLDGNLVYENSELYENLPSRQKDFIKTLTKRGIYKNKNMIYLVSDGYILAVESTNFNNFISSIINSWDYTINNQKEIWYDIIDDQEKITDEISEYQYVPILWSFLYNWTLKGQKFFTSYEYKFDNLITSFYNEYNSKSSNPIEWKIALKNMFSSWQQFIDNEEIQFSYLYKDEIFEWTYIMGNFYPNANL